VHFRPANSTRTSCDRFLVKCSANKFCTIGSDWCTNEDVDLHIGATQVLHGKGDRRRTVGIDPGAFPAIQRQLGHASPQTTDIYLSRIAPKEVLEHITARNWDAR